MPLVHRKFTNADLDVKAIIVLDVHAPLHQKVFLHTLVYHLATLDFGNELPPSVSIVSHDAFVPDMLVLIRALWTFSSSHANEYAHFTPRPLAHSSLIQGVWGRVKRPSPVVVKDRLPNLDGFEKQPNSGCRPTSLPNFAIEFRCWFLSRVV